MIRVLFYLLCACWNVCFAENCLQTMTLEEKVGQLLLVHFQGEVANEDARVLIQECKAGGFNYYNWANGLNSPLQVQNLSAGLQKLTNKIPLFIAVDQEGGIVARLTQGFTSFPGNKALAMTGKPHLAQEAALAMGQELHAVGVNFNLAPVVDVNSNPHNPVIGIRSFGDDPELVVLLGGKMQEGFRQAGVISSLKHFPGHGDVMTDSHEDLPVVSKSLEELKRVELLPFAKLAASADTIMTAHILVPALDAENCATLSPKILSYLKNEIGFQGVIISDSLVMEGVLKKCGSVEEAAIQALCAGCDILTLGGRQLVGGHPNLELQVADIQRIHNAIVQAVKTGRVPQERLNDAVEKILKLKERYLVGQAKEDIRCINTPEHQALAQKIAALAIQTIPHESNASLFPLSEKKIVLLFPQILKCAISQTSLVDLGSSIDTYFFSLNPSEEEISAAQQHAQKADVLLVCTYNAWKAPEQVTLINSLPHKPLILLTTRDPLDATFFPQANLILNLFSPTVPSLQAVDESVLKLGVSR